MRISELEGSRVALWGFGREGRAAHAALRRRFPEKPLTLFCPQAEHGAASALADRALEVAGPPSAEALAGFDVVIKSPGISRYRPPADAARALGATFTSGSALWFAEGLPGLKLCVTGTKGKSTTCALIAHLLRARGLLVGLGGNIGLPLLDLLEPALMPAAWVIELSSYQTGDARDPDVAVVLNLFPEHLDWHGSQARYFEDKLALVTGSAPRAVVLNHADPGLRALGEGLPAVRWFGREDGWHLRDGVVYQRDQAALERLPDALPGAHNGANLCAALTAIEALGFDATPLVARVAGFRALPHRLQRLGTRDGVEYVDDSIATTPHASLAALEVLRERRVAIIVGGFDRGLDWTPFAERLRAQPLAAAICIGQNGARIHDLLVATGVAASMPCVQAGNLPEAVELARQGAGPGGVVLLSPGAPSFPAYRDYADRGDHFAVLAGFDATEHGRLPGLGIA